MKKNLIKIGWPVVGLAICGFVLLLERSGINSGKIQNIQNAGTKEESSTYSESIELDTECLLIMDSSVEVSVTYYEIMSFILDSMSVGYDQVDLKDQKLPELKQYQTIVLAITDLSYLKEGVFILENWVKNGGSLMNAYTYEPGSYFHLLSGKLGIVDGGNASTTISGIKVEDEFMIGGGRSFDYGDKMEVSLNVLLDDSCQVYVKASDNQIPILWEKDYGKGKFVVMNQEVYSKTNRGLLSAAYSLLQDSFVYPVINASAFYIDDFPAPVPTGKNEYITRDYQTSIQEFYMNKWWPTLLQWEKKYGIVHSGMIIEEYSDQVEPPFKRQEEVEKFEFYGNMLLNNGGELGLHGYNHMPLCQVGFDYRGLYDSYELWEDAEAMKLSLDELMSFSTEMFPEQEFSVYVPPSNILSQEGRQVLVENFSNIKVIASSYLPTDDQCEYIQEFEIGEDGLIETPRITSGSMFGDYAELATFSELNFHYVQSHFLHPDDALDEDRGAALGWETLSKQFEEYVSWIYDVAPNLRDVTGSQMGQAVECYDTLTIRKTYEEQGLKIELGGFSKEAYLMLRVNQGQIETMEGGNYENLTGNLYLIHALQDEINITWSN